MIDWVQIGIALIASGGVFTVIVTAIVSRKDRAVVRYEKLVDDLSEDMKRLRAENVTLRGELAAERETSRKQAEQITFLQTKFEALERQLKRMSDEHPTDHPLRQISRALWG